MGDPFDDWQEFNRELEARMEKGQEEYGNRSFKLPPSVIADEWEQEALDIAGWGFVLWQRIRRLKRSMEGNNSGS